MRTGQRHGLSQCFKLRTEPTHEKSISFEPRC